MTTQSVPAICYDLPTVSGFFRSAAFTIACEKHIRSEWVTYRDSAVLNAIYALMFWKTPPGNVQIHQPQEKINNTTNYLHERYLTEWLKKLHLQGPYAGQSYISAILDMRRSAQMTVDDVFRHTSSVNREVAGETARAIKNLARLKLGGTVGVAALGAVGSIALLGTGAVVVGGSSLAVGGSALAVSGTSLGYSLSLSMIKTWEQAGMAKAVGIDVGKAGASEAADRLANVVKIKAVAQQSKAQQIMSSAKGQIDKYSKVLSQEGLRKARMRKATNIVKASRGQMQQQQQVLGKAAQTAKMAKFAQYGIPLVFAAWDIWDAFTTYQEDVKAI